MSPHSVVKGKSSELRAIAILLQHGFRVFQSVADIEGIDCGVLGPDNHFYPIQVKSREGFSDGRLQVKADHFFSDMFIIILDSAKNQAYWVMPAAEFQRMASPDRAKGGYLIGKTPLFSLTYKDSLAKFKGEKGLSALKSLVDHSGRSSATA